MKSGFQVSESVSFDDAIALTQSLLDQIERDEIGAADLESSVSQLVHTLNGARGFFVVYLTDDRPIADNHPAAIVAALKSAPDLVASLLIKNLAMSTAMVLAHQRNQANDLAHSSQRVSRRSADLMQRLALPTLQTEAERLWQSLASDTGAYVDFLRRWGYDAAQKQQIQAVLQQTFPLVGEPATPGPQGA